MCLMQSYGKNGEIEVDFNTEKYITVLQSYDTRFVYCKLKDGSGS